MDVLSSVYLIPGYEVGIWEGLCQAFQYLGRYTVHIIMSIIMSRDV